ncbi:MAG: 6-carboxytetrahydropterin synthase [Actinomycetota bacterium]|nr:6-carboxytetrahydropterin synthase [Actinomycetota bacterium]
MYEVGLSKSFSAWHVMPDTPGPEGIPHQHQYRLDVVVSRKDLDDREMVVDIDVLQAVLDQIVGDIAGQDLERILPPDGVAVTVEYLAKWAFDQISSAIVTGGGEELAVRVWESVDAFGGYFGRIDRISS